MNAATDSIQFHSIKPVELRLKPGDLVEVRPIDEILATLDNHGQLDNLPFMPEMIPWCGQRFRVFKWADTTCTRGGVRQLVDCVHLEDLRCTGSAHDGCQARCLLFWKTAWLRPIDCETRPVNPHAQSAATSASGAFTILSRYVGHSDGTLVCQASQIRYATCPLVVPRHLRHVLTLLSDLRRGALQWSEFRELLLWYWGRSLLFILTLSFRAPWNSKKSARTPSTRLGLQTGDLVRVRSAWAILKTLDRNGLNRGLAFKPEMFRYCGRKFKVLDNASRIIDERTGEIMTLKTACILLESVYCHGMRAFCSRSNYHYWRELWLVRCKN